MVAVANLLPTDPEQELTVLALPKEHPELRTFIRHASEKAQELFPDVTISVDAVQWEEGIPPSDGASHRESVGCVPRRDGSFHRLAG